VWGRMGIALFMGKKSGKKQKKTEKINKKQKK
jgi:hypothetical protein